MKEYMKNPRVRWGRDNSTVVLCIPYMHACKQVYIWVPLTFDILSPCCLVNQMPSRFQQVCNLSCRLLAHICVIRTRSRDFLHINKRVHIFDHLSVHPSMTGFFGCTCACIVYVCTYVPTRIYTITYSYIVCVHMECVENCLQRVDSPVEDWSGLSRKTRESIQKE